MFVAKSSGILCRVLGRKQKTTVDFLSLRCFYSSEKYSKFESKVMSGKAGIETYDENGKLPLDRFVSVDLKDEVLRASSSILGGSRRCDVDFGNHVEAFQHKSTKEILRALWVLRMCAVDSFVDNSFKIIARKVTSHWNNMEFMSWTRRVLGQRGLRILLKPTFFKQFVGGETQREVQECMKRLSEIGIRPMLAVTMEEDIGEGGDENVYNSNCARILECIEMASAEPTPSPMFQLKVSGLLPADLLVSLGNVYAAHGNKLELIKGIAQGFGTESYNVKPFSSVLDQDKTRIFTNALNRLRKIGEEAQSRSVKILVDAEFTYLNPGLSLLALAMAAAFNKNAPIVWNTYQCYLKDALSKMQEEISIASQLGVCLGAKLVRGAYIVQERARAQRLQVQDPVCDCYEATNENYNRVLKFLLPYVKTHSPKFAFIIASHNEESIKIALEKMKELDIDVQNGGVYFGQLYGMCDQVSYPLAISGYVVYKSIPYGTIDEVLPYLARRATENKTVIEGARREQVLLWKELKHRIGLKSRRQS